MKIAWRASDLGVASQHGAQLAAIHRTTLHVHHVSAGRNVQVTRLKGSMEVSGEMDRVVVYTIQRGSWLRVRNLPTSHEKRRR